MKTIKNHLTDEGFLSEWGALAFLLLSQALLTIAALLQSGGCAFVQVSTTSAGHIYYHTESVSVTGPLIRSLLLLFITEAAVTVLSRQFHLQLCKVLHPVLFLSSVGILLNCFSNFSGFQKHCVTLAAAVLAMGAAVLVNMWNINQRISKGACIAMLALMALNLGFGLSYKINGSGSWLRLGGLSLQPGELAKLFIVLFTCYCYREIRDSKTIRSLFLIVCLFSILTLVLVNDMGNALILFLLTLVVFLLYFGWVAVAVLCADLGIIGGLVLFGYYALHGTMPRQVARITMTFQALKAGRDDGDIRQMLLGVLRGGFFGVGTGADSLYTVANKAASSDYAYLTLLTLFGALIAAAVVVAFLLLFRSADLSDAQSVELSQYISGKIAVSAIAIPAIIHIGGSTNILPFTGVTLPFISSGGTSLVASYLVIGVLFSMQIPDELKVRFCKALPRGKRTAPKRALSAQSRLELIKSAKYKG